MLAYTQLSLKAGDEMIQNSKFQYDTSKMVLKDIPSCTKTDEKDMENEVVRVTVLVDETAKKEEVIKQIEKLMKKDENFQIHQRNLNPHTFSVNISHKNIQELKKIHGVKEICITKAVSTHSSKNKQISLEKDKQMILKQNDEWHIAKVYDTVTVCMVIVVLGIAGFYLHHQRTRNDRRK